MSGAASGPARSGYFERVHRATPTRFWINNPTIDEVALALRAGAVSCTTNPTYAAKMLGTPSEAVRLRAARDAAVEAIASAGVPTGDRRAAVARDIQRRAVRPLVEAFRERHQASAGRDGFVSIQGDPFAEEDPRAIVEAAHADRLLGPNVIAKIPVTSAGLEAIEILVSENIPVIATEIMSISQVVAVCEAYMRASARSGCAPAFYVTHITGIFDEHLADLVRSGRADVSADALHVAGIAVARKQIRMMRDRSYPGIVLGGGARELHHFTEFVGEPIHITINWKGTAEELIALDGPVVSRAGSPVPDLFLDELLERLPDFRKAYVPGALTAAEFKDYGPVVRFRTSFEQGWTRLLDEIGTT